MSETILITGANRGIGLEMVRQYAAAGWRVLACCRNPRQANELAALAEQAKGAVSVHQLDVGDAARIGRLADELEGQAIDILFNNAGRFGPPSQEYGPIDTEGWLETFRVNSIAPYQMAVAFAGHVARSHRRIIATMGTVMGSISDNRSGGYYAYRSSKAAVHMVVRGLAVDLQPRGIISVVFHPGWVQTDMGGAGATLSPAESVTGLRRFLGTVTPEHSGRFFDYQGRELPW